MDPQACIDLILAALDAHDHRKANAARSDLLAWLGGGGFAPKGGVPWRALPTGTAVAGMAPIGVRWGAIRTTRGLRPDAGCPRGEFAPMYAEINGHQFAVC
jgi:hypothetical protein